MSASATPRPSLILPWASHSHSQSGAVGLSSDRAATVSSRHHHDFVFVVNPSGANGRTGKQWKQLLPHLRTRLVDQCSICESITFGKEVQFVHLIEGLTIQRRSVSFHLELAQTSPGHLAGVKSKLDKGSCRR